MYRREKAKSDKMSLKLVYFDIRGRAEYIRLALEAGGQKYEEVRVSFDEWPKVKPTTPFGSLPYIQYDGKVYSQSNAIATYVARQNGSAYGKTEVDGLRIDEVVGLWNDQMNKIVSYRFAKSDADKAEFLKKVLEEEMPKYFDIFEKFLKDNGSTGYFVGNSVSLADLYVYDMQDNIVELKKDALKKYPLMQKLRQNVQSHSKLKAYLTKRKKTAF